jgi:hypothetical protein
MASLGVVVLPPWPMGWSSHPKKSKNKKEKEKEEKERMNEFWDFGGGHTASMGWLKPPLGP